ncbi:aliphatic nitrilase [Microdochium trichocladiopsis]|uniref:nitrilase n=1 Tax=Microdochium trichocladiopsis TaxID=1682393 RepID=A0A9P9BVW6_9PEZI|nr:aliphatic nitrilase [Microdochium trichocladiopsis]KAH7033732.1 aliphatic nitrilase [Microdochium trichocladiopsis]
MATTTPKNQSHVRVAVTQAEPVWLDLEATVTKTCTLIHEAATHGAQIVVFPECWVPGYPAWIWTRPVDEDLASLYIRNSLKIDSPLMAKIRRCASDNNIVVVLGFSENVHNSLYISQATIDATGELVMTRAKIKATHMERTIFGDAPASCLNSVAATSVGRVGALSCWEHLQPLLKYHTYTQREQIHVAAWPPLYSAAQDQDGLWSMGAEGTASIASVYAMESQSFVLHCTAIMSQAGIDKLGTADGKLMARPGGGHSAVYAPDGRRLTELLPDTEEGIVYATIDLNQILRAKAFLDVCGHYSRPELLWLGVDRATKEHVRDTP